MDRIMRWCVPDRALHVSFEFNIALGLLIRTVTAEVLTFNQARAIHPWL